MHAITSIHTMPEEHPLVIRIVEFVRYLRDNNFRVGVMEDLDALLVTKHCNVLDQQRLHWGLRSLLCTNSDDWERFDELFNAFWEPPNTTSYVQSTKNKNKRALHNKPDKSGESEQADDIDRTQSSDDEEGVGQGASKGGASKKETHLQTDFRFLTDLQQLHLMEQMVERLAKRIRRRLIRRQHDQRQGRRIHLRRTIRNNLCHGGTPVELVFRQRRRRLPRLILLLDVSRSMNLYSYLFLRFARGLLAAFKDADAFVYHTHLVHITDALREQDINIVKQKLALISAGWSGGTRIGESLQKFNNEYGRHIINSHTIVINFSDGLDTGPPELLTEQLAFIKRKAKRLVWLNPLIGREGYEPVTQCMAAALPLIDVFASAHNLESLLALESHLANL